jgi:ABC-type multidrug transport system fused ATPase/permease subunit
MASRTGDPQQPQPQQPQPQQPQQQPQPTSMRDVLQSIITDAINANSTETATNVPQSIHPAVPEPESVFKLPITYLPKEDRHALSKPIVSDLELIETKESESTALTRPLYARVMNLADDSIYGKQFLHLWSETFTSNVDYLKNTQQLISNLREIIATTTTTTTAEADATAKDAAADHKPIEAFWKSMKTSRIGFKDKFGYIDAPPFPIIEKLNTVPAVLQVLTIYNVSSPLISLMMPVFVLIVPFFILKARGVDISTDKYLEVLKMLASSHAIGKLFTEFDGVSMEKKVYILSSVVFYCIQVYQNTMSCYRFYKNIYVIHDHLIMVRAYLRNTIDKMQRILECASGLSHYHAFSGCLEAQMHSAQHIFDELADLEPFSLCFSGISRIGHVMKYYYLFFNDDDVNHMMQYTFGFNAYYEHLGGIIKHVESGALNPCKFASPTTTTATTTATTTMQDAYFLNTVTSASSEKSIVKNDIALDKKLIITGPNAAGKTTLIKTTLFNIILSQQIGYGAYSSATIAPYQFLHCYLNIPDTSGRDSLFQAESRRCKEILDCITENPGMRHFCIFDELYSGTNPYEAVASAYGYVSYISDMRNVDFMLTTHYIQLCELFQGTTSKREKREKREKRDKRDKLDKRDKPDKKKNNNNKKRPDANPNIRNLHMSASVSNTFDYTYHYKVVSGISKIRGGIKVLLDLRYPDAIIETTKSVL